MKTWLDRIVRNSSYLRLVVNYYKSDEISSFKKVSSYTVSDIDINNRK